MSQINVTGGEVSMNVRRTTQIDVDIDFTPDPALKGQTIRAADAAIKYDISDTNLSRWADRGLISVVEQGPKLLILDETSVARAAAIFKQARRVTGSAVRAGYILKRMS